MDFDKLTGIDNTKFTLTQLWRTRGGANHFPLVVRTTDGAQFLVVHEVERRYTQNETQYIGICQGHAHLLDDEEIYRKASESESQSLFMNLNVNPPSLDPSYEPDKLTHRWMYENGTGKDLSMTDYFAAHAITGLIMNHHAMPRDEQTLASKSYDFAEAMVRERSKRYNQ